MPTGVHSVPRKCWGTRAVSLVTTATSCCLLAQLVKCVLGDVFGRQRREHELASFPLSSVSAPERVAITV